MDGVSSLFSLYGLEGTVDDVQVEVIAWGDGLIVTTILLVAEDIVYSKTCMNPELGDLKDVTNCVNLAVDATLKEWVGRIKDEGGTHGE